jgi:hypothetical protein
MTGWVDGWMRGMRMGGWWAEREGKGEYRFSSLMKLEKKEENYRKKIFYIFVKLMKQKKKEKALLITTGLCPRPRAP